MRVSSLPNLNITFSLMPSQFNVCSLLTPLYSILWRPIELPRDRKSTRLNSSHLVISYAVFCLKKKKVLLLTSSAAGAAVHSRHLPQTCSHATPTCHVPVETLLIKDSTHLFALDKVIGRLLAQ